MLLTADLLELISTNLLRVLVIAMVVTFLFKFFVELIKNDLLVMQIFKKALWTVLDGAGNRNMLHLLSFSGFVST
jgi:hypothetical protein